MSAPGSTSGARPRGRTPLLVHIGYHKTGTTWLQHGLFLDAGAGFARAWSSREIRAALVAPTPLEWDEPQTRRELDAARATVERAGLCPVLSDERLSGSPHAGGFDSAQIAERLARVAPDARILVVVREQRQVLYSVYQQYVRDGGAASLRYYFSPRRVAEVPQFRFEHFEYHRLVHRYQELFGVERVLVLPFEELARDAVGFAARIASFAGREGAAPPRYPREYPSFQAVTILLKRWANRFLVRTALNPAGLFYVKDHERRFVRLDRRLPRAFSARLERRWRRWLDAAVGERYATSNGVTEELTGLDLAAFGYAVARTPSTATGEARGART